MSRLSQKRDAERRRLEALIPSENDPHSALQSGVLPSDEITYYAENHHLIEPFDRANLKPAGYELTVGDEYFLSGEFHKIGPNDIPKITIPSFKVAVLKTGETLCLPRYLIARWNIRVKHAYSGLLWVGGPQVDPGYVGHLFCPIYNLSDRPVVLQPGEAIALMDFVKTTPFDSTKPASELIRYPCPPKRLIIEDYRIDELRSALFTRAGEKLAELDESIRTLETRFITFTQISFGIFALAIAVAVASRTGDSIPLSASVLGALTLGISVAALLIAWFSYVQWRIGRLVPERYGILMANRARDAQRFLRRRWLWSLALSLMLAVSGGVAAYMFSERFFRDIRQQRVIAKSNIDTLNAATAEELRTIASRLQRIESQKLVTVDDLERFKSLLDQQIQSLRP
jgi:deoxycytidine triphosphate deaminase